MKRAYRFCLFLYPRHHRDLFAEEMLRVLDEASADSRDARWSWHIRFAFSEIAGLLSGAAAAWLAPKNVARVASSTAPYMPQELLEAQRRVDANIAAMVHAIANHQFERARQLSDQERVARANLHALRDKYGDELGMSF